MNRRQLLACLGGVLLIFGVFSPVAEVFWVKVDYFQDGEADGVLVLIFLAIAAPFLLTERFPRVPWIPIVLMGAVLVYDFFNFYDKVGTSYMGWAWIPLFAGLILLVAAALTRTRQEPYSAPMNF